MSHARNIGRVQRWIPWLLLSRWKPRTVETHPPLKFGGGSDPKFKIELGKKCGLVGVGRPRGGRCTYGIRQPCKYGVTIYQNTFDTIT